MEIDVREINARPVTEYRYRITVYKKASSVAAYYLDFKKVMLRMRQWLIGAYPASEVLDNAYVMELYNVRALETRAEITRSLFDTYTRMAYTRDEREQLFIMASAWRSSLLWRNSKRDWFSAYRSGQR
ncbi:hypothetical protein [Serratia sp. FDAARGOS_506]|uniref:hypothetical protein n=1 Tax=Serratia sp. FDAARGOS_506 TaxID=2420306 RepID=UPI0020A26964|nr:hypothetical protein [Serratia sp. FDAARGOS_506]